MIAVCAAHQQTRQEQKNIASDLCAPINESLQNAIIGDVLSWDLVWVSRRRANGEATQFNCCDSYYGSGCSA